MNSAVVKINNNACALYYSVASKHSSAEHLNSLSITCSLITSIWLDSLSWWHRIGFSKSSADAIRAKMEAYGYQPTEEELLTLRHIGYFIDCKCSPTSVVGGGPAEDGANAARWDVDINRAFYNSWKSVHGLKHQTGNLLIIFYLFKFA